MNEIQDNAGNTGFWVPMRLGDLPRSTRAVADAVIDKIPALPPAAARIIQMTADDDAYLEELVEQIASDPILASKILKEVNSTYYGLHRKTDNLQLAVVMLGFKEVRRIAITSCIARTLGDGAFNEECGSQDFWEHSYLVSICAGMLANDNEPQSIGTLMTFGLLHDIGKFVLYAIAVQLQKKGISVPGAQVKLSTPYLLEKEEMLFGVNHAIMGGLLAEKWNLSERLAMVLASHHHPSFFGISEIPGTYRQEIATICIADLVVNTLYAPSTHLPEPHAVFFEIIGRTPPVQSIITDELIGKLDSARTFIQNTRHT
jgi:HD-like signal output (HDOD) protein